MACHRGCVLAAPDLLEGILCAVRAHERALGLERNEVRLEVALLLVQGQSTPAQGSMTSADIARLCHLDRQVLAGPDGDLN
mmetsp:Transcript_117060/g.215310  ORF Transcript_117060/g.215310 Transcript_117060/m.215310 type:complete len:81 (+) Transcript_117060:146-388(+)